jgi:hypothetical protein
LSISTLEHVGWDELTRDDEKIPKALKNLKSLLKSNGTMIVTLPFGYNRALDKHLNQDTIRFDEQYYLLRTKNHSWQEASWDEIKQTKFDNPYSGANGITVGFNYDR